MLPRQKEIRFTQKASAGFYRSLPEAKKADPNMQMMMRRMMKSSAVIGACRGPPVTCSRACPSLSLRQWLPAFRRVSGCCASSSNASALPLPCSILAGSHSFGPDGKGLLPPLAGNTPFARKPIVRTSFYRRTGVFTS
eukprot:SAG11_NODE_1778_length_4265_cov_1.686750_2_plen_138_part_00